jgi:hypothetical protein
LSLHSASVPHNAVFGLLVPDVFKGFLVKKNGL